jgi:hypothetical protein
MLTKLMGSVVAASILFSVAAPIAAYAADAPKTKSECAKIKTMKWDAVHKTCVKK